MSLIPHTTGTILSFAIGFGFLVTILVQEIAKNIAVVSGLVWVLSALRLYTIGWGGYIIMAGLVAGVGYLIYRTRGKSIIKHFKKDGQDE